MHLLHSLFTNAMGGTERHLADLANAQVAAGHRVTIMLRCNRKPYGADDPFLQWLDPSIQVIVLPGCWPVSRWPYWPIRYHVKRLKPDIIHTHHGRDSRYLARAADTNTPVVATLHMPYRHKDFKRHKGLICVSSWQMADIPNAMRARSVVIPNWVKPLPEVPAEKRAALRQQLGVDESTRVFGAVGRLTIEKGMDDLLEAFMAAHLENTLLCIFGDGEMRPALEKMIAQSGNGKNIRLMGYEQDIRPWYDAFDWFVLPSRQETFGLVLLEAMAAKCPILTTKTRGALEMLGDNHQVIWADISSPLSLMAALKRAALTPRERWHYPELELHDFRQAMQAVFSFYRRLLR